MLERGQAGGAGEYARRATEKDPSNAEGWLTLGAAYEAAGRHTLAKSAYRSCTERAQGGRIGECRALLDMP